MLTKAIAELQIEDIKFLAQNRISENRYIDFKSAPVGNSDDAKREFVADVTAFANASGGDIIFGVTAEEGVAVDATGIDLPDPDKEKLRLGDLIRTGTEPRLSYIDMKWLEIAGQKGILIVRVPRSWTAPHRVTLRGHDKFYIRNPAGKHPMNVDELRRAFTLSEELTERIRQFILERIRVATSDEGPFRVRGPIRLLVHFVPLSSFAAHASLNLDHPTMTTWRPWDAGGWAHRHTLEGIATIATTDKGGVHAYTMAFRNGVLEALGKLPYTEGPNQINVSTIERYIVESWEQYVPFMRHHGIVPPVYVFVTLLGVGSFTILAPIGSDLTPTRFPRSTLLLPELEVRDDTVDTAPYTLLRPLLDTLANAFGLPRSPNYVGDAYRPANYP